MRVAVLVMSVLLAACASDKLALTPPSGVDFSGRWQLNEADSDDPLRLVQSQTTDPSRTTTGSGGQGGPGGSGGRGGRQGRGNGGFGNTGPAGPSMPGVDALGEGLRWPGKDLEIKQVAGVVAISSGGVNRVYQPASARKHPHGRPTESDSNGRDAPERDQDTSPVVCGWDDKTLVVQGGDPDDDHPPFDERYSVSDDRQRLIEVISFKGGRSGGYTVSRVWDKVLPGAPPGSMPGTPQPGGQGVPPGAQGCYYADDPLKCGKE